MNKHTPGPWAINEILRQYSGKLEIQSGDTHIASVTVGKKGITPEQEANANLISAAPELLEALDLLFSHKVVNTPGGGISAEAREKARAAIAKARGEA